MATSTYTAIASITLGSSASSVTFSSIPQDYRDLVLVFNGKSTVSTSNIEYTFNNNTTAVYSYVGMEGRGSVASSVSGTNTPGKITNGTKLSQTTVDNMIFQIMDYSATDKHKTVLFRYNANERGEVQAQAQRYPSTTAISSFEIFTDANEFASGSTFSLFGIEA